MFNGGHQRHSYPLDKRVPKMPKKEREMNYGLLLLYWVWKWSATSRKTNA